MNPFRMLLTQLGNGEISYLHNNSPSHSCAFLLGEKKSIRVCIPRSLGTSAAKIAVYAESGEPFTDINGTWSAQRLGNDEYEFKLPSDMGVGLYFFTIVIQTPFGMLFAHKSGNVLNFSDEKPEVSFQLSISNFKYEEPSKAYGGIIYHIFVDRFAKGNVKKPLKYGATIVSDWSDGVPEYPEYPGAPLKNNTYYGGDLWGIIDKLPYIASLGVTHIYLSPIFDAASNHKYDVGDYMKVDEMFGGEEALVALIKNAEKLGIGILLDGVFNHTGDDSVYFNKYANYDSCGAYQSQSSPYYEWYDFKSHPDDYTSWWGIEILPRIHPDKESCGRYFVGSGGVIEHYANLGIAGMRLDVVDELSDGFVASIKHKLNEKNLNSLLYGEVWEDASNKIAYGKRKRYYLGDELDGVMNYPIRKGIINYLLRKGTGDLLYALTDIIDHAPKRIADVQMNILGSHDTERILTVLSGICAEGKSNEHIRTLRMTEAERTVALKRLKQAFTILSTLPGIPSIFYGDEAGLEGYDDPFNRMPYPWGCEDKSLLAHYRKIGSIRRDNDVYKRGEFKLLELSNECLIFARCHRSNAYITVVNNTDTSMNVSFDKPFSSILGTDHGMIEGGGSAVFKTRVGASINYNFAI